MTNIKNIDYAKSMNELLKQTFSSRIYKNYSVGQQVALHSFTWIPCLIMILMLPFYYSVLFMYKLITAPIDYLVNFLEEVQKDKMHATQFIIYFIGFPMICMMQAFIAFISCYLFVIHFMINLFATFYSLGGVQFMPWINDQEERAKGLLRLKDPNKAFLIDVLVLSILTALGLTLGLGIALGMRYGGEWAYCFIFIFMLISWIVVGFNKHNQVVKTNNVVEDNNNVNDTTNDII